MAAWRGPSPTARWPSWRLRAFRCSTPSACQRRSSCSGSSTTCNWLLWFLEQLGASAERNSLVVEAVRAKALFWWSHRHHSFNPRQQKLLNRLLDAEPEGFEGGLTLRKAIGLTRTSRAYRIRWPGTHQSAQPHLRK